jgi:hypothetical protein
MSYLFYNQLTILSARVTGNQANFPLLVSATSASFLRTLANGGAVRNTVTQSGGAPITIPADLVFATDILGTTRVPWEIKSYDASTGTLVAWVKLSISSLADATLYICYGDALITTQQNTGSFSPANVWDANYKGVYHLGDGTTLSTVDSTTNANNAASGPTAAAGKIDGGAAFNGTQGAYIGNPASMRFTTGSVTLSAWFKTTASGGYAIVSYDGGSNIFALLNGFPTANRAGFRDLSSGAGNNLAANTGTSNDGNWHYVVGVRDTTGGLLRMYYDGAAAGTISVNGANTTNFDWTIGKYTAGGGGGGFDGTIDEVRLSVGIARSAGWIASEYNNQNIPGNWDNLEANRFITWGAQTNNFRAGRAAGSNRMIGGGYVS